MHLPRGFEFAGVRCDIKRREVEDLTLIVCRDGAVAAGVYTQNLVQAAPVVLDRSRTPLDGCRAVVVNSGNANACTGAQGMRDAEAMAALAAEAVGPDAEGNCDARRALVMSTGVIGVQLPMDKIRRGVAAAARQLAATEEGFHAASRGILTTDQGPKISAVGLPGGVAIAGMAKGAGMIGPKMATMLAIVLTDERLTVGDAQESLRQAVEVSFNCIRVDGHTSTNDTLLLLSSGKASAEPAKGERLAAFRSALSTMCIELAQKIPDDGEGASHLMQVHVQGAPCRADARRIAEAVADSPLVKAGIAGNDPNWGRIVSAAGYAGVDIVADSISLTLNDIKLYERGEPTPFDRMAAHAALRDSRLTRIELVVGDGPGEITIWASDLTVDYVRFNSEYFT